MSGVALITGAASGIGLATARAFAPRVASLVLSDLNEANLAAFAAELRAEFPKVEVLPFVGDMGREEDIVKMHAHAKAAFGRVDYAVNNAGIAALGRMAEFKTADWDRVTAVNERGVFLCMREQLALMEKQEPLPLPAHITGPAACESGATRASRAQRGSIVNISSVLGFAGVGGNAPYVAAKHALVGMAKEAAIEYGALGVRVNNIAPGFVATALTTSPQAIGYLRAATTQGKTPMARAGLPEEIADVIVFLSSHEASFVNGATWTVDGGYLAL